MLTGMRKEIRQVNVVFAVGIFGKTDGADGALVKKLTVVRCIVNTAKINEIERRASQQKNRFKIIVPGNSADGKHVTALAVY